tara:strand:- start:96 stop:341 length:246 start_codon:yes stop_codon:yes gene_type:complete
MKKCLPRCADCGDDSSILTQVSSGLEVILLCSDCHNLKYLKEVQNEIRYVKKKTKRKELILHGLEKFNYLIIKSFCFHFHL